jgi:mono/diheme cytochrome c family protein
MLNILNLIILIVAAALLAWASIRAWRQNNRLLKWAGAGLAALMATAVSCASALTTAGLLKQHGRSAPVPYVKVAGTPEQIQRGEAIANGFCSGCHSKTGHLTGGMDVGEHFPIPIGSFVSSNLTPAGALSRWSDGQIFGPFATESMPTDAGCSSCPTPTQASSATAISRPSLRTYAASLQPGSRPRIRRTRSTL